MSLSGAGGPTEPRPDRPRVALVYDYVPRYRAEFLERARASLASKGVEFDLYYGQAPDAQMTSKGQVSLSWGKPIKVSWWRLGGGEVRWHHKALRLTRGYDLVISQQANRTLVNVPFLLWQRFGGPKVVLWGHGENFAGEGRVAGPYKAWMTRQVHWFFAYTQQSAEIAAGHGVPPDRITVVQNSMDTDEAQRTVDSVTDEELARRRAELGIQGDHVAVYVGRWVDYRKPDYLIAAAEAAREALPDFEIVVIGEGPNDPPVREAAQRLPWFHHVGSRFGRDLIVDQLLGNVLLMPDPIGLVAVDSFVLGRPLVTVDRDDHGPEFDYLTEETTLFLPRDISAAGYGREVARLLQDDERVARLREGCRKAAGVYTLDEMVRGFTEGVLAALGRADHSS